MGSIIFSPSKLTEILGICPDSSLFKINKTVQMKIFPSILKIQRRKTRFCKARTILMSFIYCGKLKMIFKWSLHSQVYRDTLYKINVQLLSDVFIIQNWQL